MAKTRTSDNVEPMDHIFLDIVKFSRKHVDAQVHVVNALRDIVLQELRSNRIDGGQVIYLPTGDGICICLRKHKLKKPVFDLHMRLACSILNRVDAHNRRQTGKKSERKFEVRVGINSHDDVVVKDVNGNDNVAGAGINEAQRVMSFGDGGHLMVSTTVHHVLGQWEEYSRVFRRYEFRDKHGNAHVVYQYVKRGLKGLRTNEPRLAKVQPVVSSAQGYRADEWAGIDSLQIERDVQHELQTIITRIHEFFGRNEVMKLLAIQFRLKHETGVLADLRSQQPAINLPIRNAHIYKRYVFGRIIDMLKPGYTYSTFSSMDFWSGDSPKESIRKFVHHNKLRAASGTMIRRVILVEPELFEQATCDIKRASALLDVYDKLNDQDVNDNVHLAAKNTKPDAATIAELTSANLLNLFLIKTEAVQGLVETLMDQNLPNAYITGDGQRMLVRVQNTGKEDVVATIHLEFPKDAAAFDDHTRVFARVVGVAAKNNQVFLEKVEELRTKLPVWKAEKKKLRG